MSDTDDTRAEIEREVEKKIYSKVNEEIFGIIMLTILIVVAVIMMATHPELVYYAGKGIYNFLIKIMHHSVELFFFCISLFAVKHTFFVK